MLKGAYDFVTAGRANVFAAYAPVTPSLWSTAAGMSGPLLYNGSNAGGFKGVTAYLLGVGFGASIASSVAGSLGITGGATTAPTSTTAVAAVGNLKFGPNAQAPKCSVYAVGTVSANPTTFMSFGHVHTGALTVDTDDDNFIHFGGMIEVHPGYFGALAASAVLTGATLQATLIWAETPIP